MRIELTTNEFTEVTITSGTLQNISPQASVEVASTATKNTGIILPPYATLSYSDNATVYARNAWDDDSTCVIAVEPFKKAGEGGEYTLPIATSSKLGGVKIGSNVTIAVDGTISVPAAYSLPTAAVDTLGGVKVGSGLSITDGVLSATGGGSSEHDPVGRVVYDVILRTGYIKANGATVADASTALPNLLQFVQDNPSLLAANQFEYDANHGLYLYDSGTDALTLPNFIGKFVEGGNTVEEKEAGLPNIKGIIYPSILTSATDVGGVGITVTNTFSGALFPPSKAINRHYWTPGGVDTVEQNAGVSLDASRSSSIYSDTVNTVQPPAITLIPQIKY